jgi:hemolysin activation/secretion protein
MCLLYLFCYLQQLVVMVPKKREMMRLSCLGCFFGLLSLGSYAQTPGAVPATLLINEFRVEGNTVLPTLVIEKAVMPWLGPDRKEEDIYAARDALAKAYEDAGYLSANVVAERIDPVETPDGPAWVAVLKVVEGRVGRLRVTGAEYNLPSRIKEQTASVQEGEVPHFPSLQEDLTRVGQMADMSVTPLLRPGRDPGTMEVELKVKDQLPFHAWAQLSNEQSPDTSARRLDVGARYDNLFQAQHSLSLRLITTPLNQDEVRVYTANYGLPTGVRDDKVSFYVLRSESNIQSNIGTGVVGKGTTLGMRWTRNLDATAPFFHSINTGFDYKRLGEDSETSGSRPIRYLPFALQYIAMLPDASGGWQLATGVTTNFSGMTDRKVACSNSETIDQFDCRRSGASSSFALWNGTLKRRQKLGDWEAVGRFDWQVASEPLLSSDQFSIGGADSVRGYYQSEQSGDDGERTTFELYTPPMVLHGATTKFLVFYDNGIVHEQQALSGETADMRLASYGLGLRSQFGKNLSGSLDAAHTLLPGSRTKDGAYRLHAWIRTEF